MSKRDLKKYLASLPKEELEAQLLSAYEKFSEVKAYYDFVFNPKEEKLEQEAKLKIKNEYFPVRGKRPKMRRSTAQKFIKQFLTLGADPFMIADVMLYNLEIIQKFTARKEISYASFYKSVYNSYKQAAEFITANGLHSEFNARVKGVYEEAQRQYWENRKEFERIYDNFE